MKAKEDKSLLLKDLSARLPYGVIVDYGYNAFDVHNGNYVKHGSKCILKCYLLDVFISPRQNEKGEYIKPYLRPMSSMTEEERKEVNNLIKDNRPNPYGKINNKGMDGLFSSVAVTSSILIDWLNAHHFDYHGLIEKGLAIEANESNNPYKE